MTNLAKWIALCQSDLSTPVRTERTTTLGDKLRTLELRSVGGAHLLAWLEMAIKGNRIFIAGFGEEKISETGARTAADAFKEVEDLWQRRKDDAAAREVREILESLPK